VSGRTYHIYKDYGDRRGVDLIDINSVYGSAADDARARAKAREVIAFHDSLDMEKEPLALICKSYVNRCNILSDERVEWTYDGRKFRRCKAQG
jgi:hypothetical protein